MARPVGPLRTPWLEGPATPSGLPARKSAALPGAPIPSNVAWWAALPESERVARGRTVLRKPTRTLSGVAVVAVMTAPAACPHGRCTYCPGGPEARSPQSYTGEEPSALRGAQFGWDARAITSHRLAALEAIGHPTSKVEAIIMGGTFPSRSPAYRESVLRGIYEGLNGRPSASIAEAQRANESADHRLVGLTVETRPDWCDGRVLPGLLDAGVTRVEIGVECLTEGVLRSVGRAHGVEEVERATREARDRGLKIAYHLMLGLPGMDPGRDLADFRRLFDDPAFRPDMLKIYPTLVLPGTPLSEEFRRGVYRPYDAATAADLIAAMKRRLPPWVRIQRIQRDIPARLIEAGVRSGNLRQLALARLAADGAHCRCLRCREPGRRPLLPAGPFVELEASYEAAGGRELFLSLEEPISDTVGGFLRLRLPSDATSGGLDAPVIRELKVLGAELDVGARPTRPIELQHRGVGRRLVARAEERARSAGFSRLYVTSAVGTRGYYRRLGFGPAGAHMAKALFA